jgi:transposase-like protein
MSQHFLLSAVARTLSLSSVFRMSDDEARDTLKRIRWSENNAEPFCPHCGCLIVYTLAEAPPRWRCSACRRKFSLTSGTLFHSRKLAVRDYLAVIALFVNGVKGTSALQISRDLNINPKSSFVLLHKLREAMASQVHNPDEPERNGEVQVDGAYFGGQVKLENRKSDRKDRRLAEEQTGSASGGCRCPRSERAHPAFCCVARERCSAADPPIRRVRHDHTRGRIERLESVCTRPMTCVGSITVSSTSRRRREREPSRVVLLAASPRRNRPASSDQRPPASSIRQRSGVARGQPPQVERHQLEYCDRCRPNWPGEPGLEWLLALERSMTASKDHVVSGLIEKRRELAGLIDDLQRRLDQYRADLTHIDGVLRVLAADIDPETTRPKRAYRRNRYFARNELSRLCLGALRTAAGEPLSTDDIASRVIAAKGFDSGDAILRAAIREQVGSTVKRLHPNGAI